MAVADDETWLVGVRVGLEMRRERVDAPAELADDGRRNSDGRSDGDWMCGCFGVVVCASGRVCRNCEAGPVSIAPVELRWRICAEDISGF